MSTQWALLVSVLLLLGNALAVGAEFAVVSARRTQLEPKAEAGSRRAKVALMAMENATLMLAAAQLTITLCSLGLGALAEPAVSHLVEVPLHAAGLGDTATHVVGFAISLLIVVYLHILFGEMVPKNLALAAPERSVLILAPILVNTVRIFRPFIWFTNEMANLVLRALRVQPKDEVSSTFSAEEVADLVEESRREGLIEEEEHDLLAGAIGFEGQTVRSVLLPTDSLVTVPEHATTADIEAACVVTGYSRFPVRSDNGEYTGYLHLKDVLEVDPEKRNRPIAPKWIRQMAAISADDPLRTALAVMQTRNSHMARVVDSNGNVLGVAALEDVLERLVGEVQDATQTVLNASAPASR